MTILRMRNRPKKPTEPRAISEEIGEMIFYTDLQYKVEKFREHHQLSLSAIIEICIGDGNYDSRTSIYIETEGKSHASYNKEMLVYTAELKEYNNWRKDNRVDIEKEKAKTKEQIRVRKLEKRLVKATKDAEDIRVQLECSK